jgi:hypothetical protein
MGQRHSLVRVLAIAQALHPFHGDAHAARQALRLGCEIGRDGGVVVGGMSEDLGRKLPPQVGIDTARLEQLQHNRVVHRVHYRQHRIVILGRGTEHRWSTDIDVFQRVFQRGIALGNGELEGIQVYRDQVDRDDTVFLQG